MLSDIVEERPGPRRVRHMGSGLLITMSESNHQCFVFVFHKRFRWQTLCSDCGTDGKWARALGGSLAHAMNTLLGLVSVCGPCPHCCPMILDSLALRT